MIKWLFELFFGKAYPDAEKKGKKYAKKNDRNVNELLSDALSKLRKRR